MQAELPDYIGEYQITGLLGEGAVARVFAGIQPKTGRPVAIKLLREGHSPEHRTVERFIAEVRAVKQIQHRNIIDIFGFGAMLDGRPYFVMELLPGLTLQQRIDKDGPLTFLEAAPIFAQACSALSAAHEHGIIHRDLKPENIYLVTEAAGPPLVKLLDFGIAKLVTQQSSPALTQVGSTVGTPLYMSPEQIRALPLDPRSDIYTLGVSLFQTLTGEVPFYAESHAQTATMHLTHPPPRPSQVCDLLPIPEQAEAIVLRCLEKNPSARYGSMDELKAAIEAASKELMSARQLSGMRELRLSLPSVPPLPPAAERSKLLLPAAGIAAAPPPRVSFSPPVGVAAVAAPEPRAAPQRLPAPVVRGYPPLVMPPPRPEPVQEADGRVLPEEGIRKKTTRQEVLQKQAAARRQERARLLRRGAWALAMLGLGFLLFLLVSHFLRVRP